MERNGLLSHSMATDFPYFSIVAMLADLLGTHTRVEQSACEVSRHLGGRQADWNMFAPNFWCGNPVAKIQYQKYITRNIYYATYSTHLTALTDSKCLFDMRVPLIQNYFSHPVINQLS